MWFSLALTSTANKTYTHIEILILKKKPLIYRLRNPLMCFRWLYTLFVVWLTSVSWSSGDYLNKFHSQYKKPLELDSRWSPEHSCSLSEKWRSLTHYYFLFIVWARLKKIKIRCPKIKIIKNKNSENSIHVKIWIDRWTIVWN